MTPTWFPALKNDIRDVIFDTKTYPIFEFSGMVFILLSYLQDIIPFIATIILFVFTFFATIFDFRNVWIENPESYTSQVDMLGVVTELSYCSFIGQSLLLWSGLQTVPTVNRWNITILVTAYTLFYIWFIGAFVSKTKNISIKTITDSIIFNENISNQTERLFETHRWVNKPSSTDDTDGYSQFYIPLNENEDFSILLEIPPDQNNGQYVFGGQGAFNGSSIDTYCCMCDSKSKEKEENQNDNLLFIYGVRRIQKYPFIVKYERDKICENCANEIIYKSIQKESVALESEDILSQVL